MDRNRLKRRLRELVRLELLPTLRESPVADVAIRARREAYAASGAALKADVLSIVAALDRRSGASAPTPAETRE